MISTPLKKAYYIDYINAITKRKGIGKTLINVAKADAQNLGYGKNIYLISSSMFDKQNSPHLFYRKMGFETKSKIINRYMDLCIKLKTKPCKKLLGKEFKMFFK